MKALFVALLFAITCSSCLSNNAYKRAAKIETNLASTTCWANKAEYDRCIAGTHKYQMGCALSLFCSNTQARPLLNACVDKLTSVNGRDKPIEAARDDLDKCMLDSGWSRSVLQR